MAATFNRELGVWQLDGRGAYDSKEAAELAEASGASGAEKGPDTLEFDMGGIQASAPSDAGNIPNPNNPGGISDNELRNRQRAMDTSATTTANLNRNRTDANRTTVAGADGTRVAIDPATALAPIQSDRLGPRSYGVGSVLRDGSGNIVHVRGDKYAGESDDIMAQMGTVTDHGFVGGVQELGFEPPATSPGGPGGGGTGTREEDAANRTAGAETTFTDEDAENQAINAQSWGKAWDAIDDVKGGDYELSDEARGYQREGLQQQRDLLERLMGFDPNQYATQFADQALARQVALGRSQGTSAASQQAGMFAAMDQAPSLYAEGARQASSLENQRLNAAETAAKSFGELGTMTRGQDEQRAQFESNLSLELANSVAQLTQGQVSLNQQESQMFAEMWTDFAQLQSVYAGMDSDEQMAWWQLEAQKRGQDKQLEGILASLKAGGAISSKDLVGGLFQLGGGIISGGSTILAANAGEEVMPNLRGFTPLADNPEWITLDFEDGTKSHPIQDPTGEYRKEVANIVPKVMAGAPPTPMAGALAQNDVVTGASPMPPVATDAPAPPMAPPAPPPVDTSHIPDAAMGALGDMAPLVQQAQQQQALAELARRPVPSAPLPADQPEMTLAEAQAQAAQRLAAPAPVAQPVSSETAPQPMAPDPYAPRYMQAGATGPSTQVTNQTTTQGLTKADRAKVDAANEAAVQAAEKANQEEYTAKSYQLMSDWQRLGEDAKKQIVEKQVLDEQQKFYDERLEKQYAKLDADAARKIDPSEAFAGDAGAYAFMAGFGDAISNFGAALAGRGPVADPSARIEGIINRSVRLQTEQKQADLEAGKISANRLEADREHVRFKLATVGKQMAENELDRAHTKDEYAALGAMKKKMEAIQQDARAKNAMATAKQETNSRTTQTQPGSPGGPVDYFLGEDQTKNGGWKAVESHGARQAGGDQIENAVGRFQKATGYVWDPQALNGAGAFKDANGKVVSADKADVPGVTGIGTNLKILSGEMGREVQGALGDLAAGRAKIADPVGAVSDKSIDAQTKQMAAGTDEGAFRAMESAARQLRGMRTKVDSESSPGVVNASRLRRQEEKGFQASRPGLPTSRAATPEDLRGKPKAEPDGLPKGEAR